LDGIAYTRVIRRPFGEIAAALEHDMDAHGLAIACTLDVHEAIALRGFQIDPVRVYTVSPRVRTVRDDGLVPECRISLTEMDPLSTTITVLITSELVAHRGRRVREIQASLEGCLVAVVNDLVARTEGRGETRSRRGLSAAAAALAAAVSAAAV
jgi:uncharacterized protein (DUF302 family)